MALPINIDELLTGHTVEWERIEFKTKFMIHPEFIEFSKVQDEVIPKSALSWH
jgi:hypothetical protein